MSQKLQFRVSSATKSILGKDLIVKKDIAIFELVKNSYDACASRVDIHIDDEKIIITDNGDGMDFNDLQNKWLYVGYSEKSDKKNIVKKSCKRRRFAGAKGIGRLACDRLGKNLQLTSIKNKKIEQLNVNWGDFEKDSKVDFNKINVVHSTLNKVLDRNFKKGTKLEITALREKWDKDDVGAIEKHLTKLISPIKEDKDKFKIFIHHQGKINEVENFIFDKLGLKTTKINVSVSKDGKLITTELVDRGDRIYKIIEKNEWSKKIADIKIELLYLSRPTKLSFLSLMKERTYNFGSIFLYKNGFRVFPYGETDDDSLSLDRRKGQGYARYLGTRELMGYIVIENNSNEFTETSSRDGGLLDTKGVQELEALFIEKTLKRLEVYTIDTLSWTYRKGEGGEGEEEFFPKDRKKEINELIQKLIKSKDFISLEYDYANFEKKIEKKINEGFQGATGVLKKQAQKTDDKSLKKAVEKIEEIQKKQTKTIKQQEKTIVKKEEEGTALRSILSNPYFKNIIDFHHDISIASGNVEDSLDDALISLEKKDYKNLGNVLEIIKFENSKILSISKIATGSGMKDGVHKKKMAINKKISSYLKEYDNLYSALKISIEDTLKEDFIIPFRYHDLVTILDNLLSNSRKHKAKIVGVTMIQNKNMLELSFSDNGKGLDKIFKNSPEDIFKSKTSSTNGAGWGLYQTKEILEEMNGGISVSPQKNGLEFNIYFKK